MQLKALPNERTIVVSIDYVDYAYIENVTSFHDIDVEKVANWVNKTCYNDNHLCSDYIPPRLDFNDFKEETE